MLVAMVQLNASTPEILPMMLVAMVQLMLVLYALLSQFGTLTALTSFALAVSDSFVHLARSLGVRLVLVLAVEFRLVSNLAGLLANGFGMALV